MRWFAAALALAATSLLAGTGCKRDRRTPPRAPKRDAAPVEVDWKACDVALAAAATAPLDTRPQLVIDGCKVCGDWSPLLHWATPTRDGGPSEMAIENTMETCGYCNADGKQRFLGALDAARGTPQRTPWRRLGEVCKAAVSAEPDARFMTAPYYALDRIARAAQLHGGATAAAAAALELPLPAVTLTGVGPSPAEVPKELAAVVVPNAGPLVISLFGDQIFIGKLPRAHLGGSGVAVDLGADGYPGKSVKLDELAASLEAAAHGDHATPIVLLAAEATPAQRLADVVGAAAKVAPLQLAAQGPAPEGWELPGTIPVALAAGSDVELADEGAVFHLAIELAKRAAAHAPSAGIFVKKK